MGQEDFLGWGALVVILAVVAVVLGLTIAAVRAARSRRKVSPPAGGISQRPAATGQGPAAATCPSCGAGNPPDSAFCDHCGASLRKPEARVCPSCRAENPPDHAFCDRCGAKL